MEQDLTQIELAIKKLKSKICCVQNDLEAQTPVTLEYDSETGGLTLADQFGTETVVVISKGVSVIQKENITISAAGWTLVGDFYEYTYNDVDITATSIVSISPNKEFYLDVITYFMLPNTLSSNGSVKLYALNPFLIDVLVSITILNP